eukprot:4634072-Alexandrium_andersonii.AAC.1
MSVARAGPQYLGTTTGYGAAVCAGRAEAEVLCMWKEAPGARATFATGGAGKIPPAAGGGD